MEKTDKQQGKKNASDSKKKRVKEDDEQRDTDGISAKDETEPESKTQTGGDAQSSTTSDNQTSKDNVSLRLFEVLCDVMFCLNSLSLWFQERPPGWSAELPRAVLLSWTFFDRQLTGSVREQDLLNILLSLGLYISPAQV